MVEYGQGPRSGARDNGLRCASYAAVGDLDPRIADALLETLRDEGIAAYAMPTPVDPGRLPRDQRAGPLTDRLYADAEHTERARELLPAPDPTARSTSTPPGSRCCSRCSHPDRWQRPIARGRPARTCQRTQPPRQVPVELPIADYRGSRRAIPALDDHFDPPPPPPLPAAAPGDRHRAARHRGRHPRSWRPTSMAAA